MYTGISTGMKTLTCSFVTNVKHSKYNQSTISIKCTNIKVPQNVSIKTIK